MPAQLEGRLKPSSTCPIIPRNARLTLQHKVVLWVRFQPRSGDGIKLKAESVRCRHCPGHGVPHSLQRRRRNKAQGEAQRALGWLTTELPAPNGGGGRPPRRTADRSIGYSTFFVFRIESERDQDVRRLSPETKGYLRRRVARPSCRAAARGCSTFTAWGNTLVAFIPIPFLSGSRNIDRDRHS